MKKSKTRILDSEADARPLAPVEIYLYEVTVVGAKASGPHVLEVNAPNPSVAFSRALDLAHSKHYEDRIFHVLEVGWPRRVGRARPSMRTHALEDCDDDAD